MITYTLKIAAIIKETKDTHTICFKQPALKKIKYLPGQYITLIITINNRKYKRPYSLSSAPGLDTTLNITVKRMPGGIVSNHLIDVLKEGDLIEVMEPMGDFIYQNHDEKNIFLWGAGSGITPLLSILKTVLQTSNQKVTLVYCNKTIDQTIFYHQLIEFEKQHQDRFSLYLFCTGQKNAHTIHGRINTAQIASILKEEDKENVVHYICGPIGLKHTIKAELTNYGFDSDQLFSEDFEHIVNEDDIKDIITRTVEITKFDKNHAVEVVRGKSILEAALDSGIDLPYSCQTGSCTICKATLIAGEVKKIGDEKMEHELRDDERLLCCSYPLSDNIKIKVE